MQKKQQRNPHALPKEQTSLLLALALAGGGGVLVEQEGGGALAAVDAVEVVGHEGAGAAVGALLAQALHLAGVLNL